MKTVLVLLAWGIAAFVFRSLWRYGRSPVQVLGRFRLAVAFEKFLKTTAMIIVAALGVLMAVVGMLVVASLSMGAGVI